MHLPAYRGRTFIEGRNSKNLLRAGNEEKPHRTCHTNPREFMQAMWYPYRPSPETKEKDLLFQGLQPEMVEYSLAPGGSIFQSPAPLHLRQLWEAILRLWKRQEKVLQP
jgi:hypothetical protein